MELEIVLDQSDYKQGIINLKKYIEGKGIPGVERIEVNRQEQPANSQGIGDILNSIGTLIEAAEKPLVELVRCLQKYVENYRTKITIPSKNGKNIVLEHGRSMSPEQLKEIVETILKNNP